MTLREMLAAFPEVFYKQTWYANEAFLDTAPNFDFPDDFMISEVDGFVRPITTVVDLARLYIEHPSRSVWQQFLWTDEVDAYGNRVYCGGVGQYGCIGFQIHRKITPSCYWVRLP